MVEVGLVGAVVAVLEDEELAVAAVEWVVKAAVEHGEVAVGVRVEEGRGGAVVEGEHGGVVAAAVEWVVKVVVEHGVVAGVE